MQRDNKRNLEIANRESVLSVTASGDDKEVAVGNDHERTTIISDVSTEDFTTIEMKNVLIAKNVINHTFDFHQSRTVKLTD